MLPEKLVVKSHVAQLSFHYFPKDGAKRAKWVTQIFIGLLVLKFQTIKSCVPTTLNLGNQCFCATRQHCTWQSSDVARAYHLKEGNWIINARRLCQRIIKIQLLFLLIMTKKCSVTYWSNLACYLIILPEILIKSCMPAFQIHQKFDLLLISKQKKAWKSMANTAKICHLHVKKNCQSQKFKFRTRVPTDHDTSLSRTNDWWSSF